MIMINGSDVIKEAAAQATGVTTWTKADGTVINTTDIAALDSFTIADVGASIIDGNGNIVRGTCESFFDGLLSVISRIETDNRVYGGQLKSLMIKDSMWGGFVERVNYHPGDIITDPKWNLMANFKNGKKNYAHEEHGFYPLQVDGRIFREAVPVLTPVSFPTDQLYEAVRNEAELQSIVNGMQAAVQNTKVIGFDMIKHMLIQCAIAVSIAGTGTAINVLERYQVETGDTSVTESNWMSSPEFIAHAAMAISETLDNMEDFSVNFNDGTVPTFADGDFKKLVILNKFAKALKFKVKANTYHDDLIGFGDFERVTSWQGFNEGSGATDYDFDSVSKVMIDADSDNKLGIGTSAFTATGVIGIAFDRYALGISPYKAKVTSQYTAIGDYYNQFHHTLAGTILDRKYNLVAFYIKDPTP